MEKSSEVDLRYAKIKQILESNQKICNPELVSQLDLIKQDFQHRMGLANIAPEVNSVEHIARKYWLYGITEDESNLILFALNPSQEIIPGSNMEYSLLKNAAIAERLIGDRHPSKSMIVFIDMKPANIAGAKFAFWDTVRDRFVELDNNQAWECWTEFNHDFQVHNPDAGVVYKDVEGFKRLCPEWVFDQD